VNVLAPEEQARRMFAYSKTANDADAAAVLGIAVDAFKRWRGGLGLRRKNASTKPKRPHNTKPEFSIDMDAIRRLLPR